MRTGDSSRNEVEWDEPPLKKKRRTHNLVKRVEPPSFFNPSGMRLGRRAECESLSQTYWISTVIDAYMK